MKDRCYFGCTKEVLHKFPSSRSEYSLKYFSIWKSVLDPNDRDQSNEFIEKNFKLCHRHFEPIYRVGTKLLREYAIPTIHNVHVKPKVEVNTKDVKEVLMTYYVGRKPPLSSLKCKPVVKSAMSKKHVDLNVQNIDAMDVQNTDTINVQTSDSNVQYIGTDNMIFQIDNQAIGLKNFNYSLEECDDSTFILHKKSPSSIIPEMTENNGSINIQDVDFTNRDLEKKAELINTSLKHKVYLNKKSLEKNTELTNKNLNQYILEDNSDVANKSLEHNGNIINTSLEHNVGITNRSLEQKDDSNNSGVEQNITHYFQNVVKDCSTDVDLEMFWLPVSPRQELQEFSNFSTKKLNDENKLTDSKNNESVTSADNNKVLVDKDDQYSVSKKELCNEWMKVKYASSSEQVCRLVNFVSSKINLNEITESKEVIQKIVSDISLQLTNMWNKSDNNARIFFKNYHDWLNSPPIKFTPCMPITQWLGSPTNPQPGTILMSLNTNGDVFKFLKTSLPPFKPEMLYETLTSTSNFLTVENKYKLVNFCKRYVSDMKFKWMTAEHKEDLFEFKFEFWLHLNVRWPKFIQDFIDSIKTRPGNTKEKNYDPIHKYPIDKLEEALIKKCNEAGQNNVSTVMHMLLHHPDDARIELITDSKCSCIDTKDQDTGLDKDPLQFEGDAQTIDGSKLTRCTDLSESTMQNSTTIRPLKKLYKPSGVHIDALKEVLDKLKSENEVARPQNPPQPAIEPKYVILEPLNSKERVLRPVLDKLKFLSKCNISSGTKVIINNQSATVVKVSNLKNAAVLVPNSNIERLVKVKPPIPSSKSGVITTQQSTKDASSVQTIISNSQSRLNLFASQSKNTVPVLPTNKGTSLLTNLSNTTESPASNITKSPIQTNHKTTIIVTKSGVKHLKKTANVPNVVKKRAAVHALLNDINKGLLPTPVINLKGVTSQNIKIIPKNKLESCTAAVSALLADYDVTPKTNVEEPSSKKPKRSKSTEDLELAPLTEFLDEEYDF